MIDVNGMIIVIHISCKHKMKLKCVGKHKMKLKCVGRVHNTHNAHNTCMIV